MRFSLKQILSATFGLAVLMIILEHAGAFSQVLESGVGAYSTAYETLVHPGGRGARTAVGFSPKPGRRVVA